MNHEFCASFCKYGVQEVGPKATQSVSVHDHNLFDQSVDNGVQKGFKPFPLEVETAPGIGDELVVRVRFLEVRLLSGKVVLLVSG